jgi:transcriptional regulator of arginine metabolism
MSGANFASKTRRQRLLAEAIRGTPVTSQDELVGRLARRGLSVTQATVSRDLNELGAFKVRRRNEVCYALPGDAEEPEIREKRLRRLISDWVESVETAANMVVIKTPPGSAHVVGSAIDHAGWPEIAGTIAGDDTLLVVIRDGHKPKKVAARISQTGESMNGRQP